jgi:hypothetical protein
MACFCHRLCLSIVSELDIGTIGGGSIGFGVGGFDFPGEENLPGFGLFVRMDDSLHENATRKKNDWRE